MVKKYTLAAVLINFLVISFLILFIGIIYTKNLSLSAIIMIFLIFLIFLIGIIKSYLSQKNFVYNLGIFITLLTFIIVIYNIIDLNNKYSYIENLYKKEYTYQVYNIYVRKKNTIYSNISKLDGKKIGMLNENKYYIQEYLKNIGNIEFCEYDSIDEMIDAVDSGEIQSLILSNDMYKKCNNSYLKYKMRVIYTDKIKKL